MASFLWLIWELTRREILQRYKGTLLGVLWPVLYAIMFLSIFSFVFAVLLRVRWGNEGGVESGAVMIFCGMVPYLFIAEVLSRSPSVIMGAQSLVKRARFPVPLLPAVATNGAFVISLINLLLLYVLSVMAGEAVWWSLLLLLVLMVPLYLLALALAWFLSASAVFFRDLSQISPVIAQVMMFLAPIFYPRGLVPDEYAAVFDFNPLTYFVEAFRLALAGGFDLGAWALALLGYGVLALLGWTYFNRMRPAFGDIL